MDASVLTRYSVPCPIGSRPENEGLKGNAFGSSVTFSGGGLSAADRKLLNSEECTPAANTRVVRGASQSDVNESAEIQRLADEIGELENEIMQVAREFSSSDKALMSYEDCIQTLKDETNTVQQEIEAYNATFFREYAAPLAELTQIVKNSKDDGFDQVYLCGLGQQTTVPSENLLYSSVDCGVGLSRSRTDFNWNNFPSCSALNAIFNSLGASENHRETTFAGGAMGMPPSQPVLQESTGHSCAPPPMPGQAMDMAGDHGEVPVSGPPTGALPTDFAEGAMNMTPAPASAQQQLLQGSAGQSYAPPMLGHLGHNAAVPVQGAVPVPPASSPLTSDAMMNQGTVTPSVSSNEGEVYSFSGAPDSVKESTKPDDNHLLGRIKKKTFILKLFEKLLNARPTWLGGNKPQANLKEQVLESLEKVKSSSPAVRANQLNVLKEKKERLENIRSFFKGLSEAKEWVSKMKVFINNKEALKGIANEGKVGGYDYDDSTVTESSQAPTDAG